MPRVTVCSIRLFRGLGGGGVKLEVLWLGRMGLLFRTVCALMEERLMVDSDTIAYPKRFLLLGMLLFKDILPILAVDHKDSKSRLKS
jgi:hypothetical protein